MSPKWTFLAALALAGGTSTAWAGDEAETFRVRFSADGSRVAALSRGVHDGSGHGYAELTVLATIDGRELLHEKVDTDKAVGSAEKATPIAEALWQKQKADLARLGIPLTRAADSVPRFAAIYPEIVPTYPLGPVAGDSERRTVNLGGKAVPFVLKVTRGTKRCPLEMDLAPEAAYTLSMAGKTVSQGQKVCSMAYGIRRVDVQGKRVLITLGAFPPGFEGPNLELFYVTASLR